MGKRVLILGNGFDLAHGLPTRYSDFLDFCEKASKIYTFNKNSCLNDYDRCNLKDWKINEYIKEVLRNAFESRKHNKDRSSFYYEFITDNKKLNELCGYIKENIWYDYFSNKTLYNCLGRNWVDFESEIKLCIKYIDENSKYLSRSITNLFEKSTLIGNANEAGVRYAAFKSAVLHNHHNHKDIKIKDVFDLRKALYEDLKKLIKALEIYLLFVEVIPINVKSNDIITNYKKTVLKEKNSDTIFCYNFDYVINFNYTHIYKNVYNMSDEVFYIHGETNHDYNNMVLGFDEYWSEKERDTNTNFTIFKKFAQRIQKRTGVENYKWFKDIYNIYKKNNLDVSKVYVFGHSLDVTDKDILYNYLESDATDVTIYCRNEETEGEYIANVIKIIGEKRLLEKVNQYPPKLKFVIQQPMVSIEEEEKEPLTSGAAT